MKRKRSRRPTTLAVQFLKCHLGLLRRRWNWENCSETCWLLKNDTVFHGYHGQGKSGTDIFFKEGNQFIFGQPLGLLVKGNVVPKRISKNKGVDFYRYFIDEGFAFVIHAVKIGLWSVNSEQKGTFETDVSTPHSRELVTNKKHGWVVAKPREANHYLRIGRHYVP